MTLPQSTTTYACGCRLTGSEPPYQPLTCPVHGKIWTNKDFTPPQSRPR